MKKENNQAFQKIMNQANKFRNINLLNDININVVGQTTLNFKNIKKYLLTNINKKLYKNINGIYLYDLKNTEIKAYYDNGLVFLNLPLIKDDKDFIKSFLHETIHSILEEIKQILNHEGLKEEYLRKRGKVLNKLLTYNNSDPKFNSDYNDLEYDEEFESYLKDKITYQIVYPISHIYFPSPYAISSLDEYICIGFEIYYLENKEWLEQFCPELYNFIQEVIGTI